MCGIAGIVDPITPPSRDLLESMAESLVKRGPDDFGWHLREAFGLAHRRLSIIDLEGGRQPIFNEDRTMAIIANGEIYDFAALRDELKVRGHRFATGSDSEVLLHLYEEERERMMVRLNGMFAFAIADFERQELFIARDRLGQKPMFYAHRDQRFAFGSGPASLCGLPWVDDAIDESAIHDYLDYYYVPAPRSIYRGIHKLMPGSWLRFSAGKVEQESYWTPMLHGSFGGTYEDAQEVLRARLKASVKRRMVADVPLGMFLSGGMDSSLICSLGQDLADQPIRTFSIGFPDPKYDERAYARQVANHIGTEHHFLEVQPDDFARLAWLSEAYEEPYCDASMLPTAMLSEFTRQSVTVALSGDAADELFGGYYRYKVMASSQWLSKIPKFIRSGCRGLAQLLLPGQTQERTLAGKLNRVARLLDADGLERYRRIISRCPDSLKKELYGEQMRAAQNPGWDSLHVLAQYDRGQVYRSPADRIMEIDMQTYLVDDVLTKVDRASMGHALEVRSPFLDPEVVELALSLPYHWKQQGSTRKRILKDAFQDRLPPCIFTRPKMGFGVPVATWLREGWREQVRELLHDSRLAEAGILSGPAILNLLEQHDKNKADHSYTLFSLIMLELWYRRYR